jgi:hypothetical protein
MLYIYTLPEMLLIISTFITITITITITMVDSSSTMIVPYLYQDNNIVDSIDTVAIVAAKPLGWRKQTDR